jgi:hypothetical protein
LHGSTAGAAKCFSVNLKTHTFHCFKCNRSGNAFDLWAAANRLSIYDTALDLCQRLNIPVPILTPPITNREEETVRPVSTSGPRRPRCLQWVHGQITVVKAQHSSLLLK